MAKQATEKQLTKEAKDFLKKSPECFTAIAALLGIDLVTLGYYLGKKSKQSLFTRWDVIDSISKAMGVLPEEIITNAREVVSVD